MEEKIQPCKDGVRPTNPSRGIQLSKTVTFFIIFFQACVPTVFEKYSAAFHVNDKQVHISLWDTAGKACVKTAALFFKQIHQRNKNLSSEIALVEE